LPYDRKRPKERTYDSSFCSLTLDKNTIDTIKKLKEKTGISFFTYCLAAFNILLNRLSEQDDIVVGIPIAGQSAIGETQLVGHCVDMLPVRSSINNQESISSYCIDLKKALIGAYKNSHCSYGRIIKLSNISRVSNRAPLMSVTFTGFSIPSDKKDLIKGVEIQRQMVPRLYETFDFDMFIREQNGITEVRCHYNNIIFSEDSMQNRLLEYEMILKAIAKDQNTFIEDIELIPEREKAELRDINNTKTQLPDILLQGLFENIVTDRPLDVAIEFDEQKITFRDLNDKASKLAQLLIQKGAQPNSFVGIYLERSIDYIISVLGVLKSGAAFLPLDPDFPVIRVAAIEIIQ